MKYFKKVLFYFNILFCYFWFIIGFEDNICFLVWEFFFGNVVSRVDFVFIDFVSFSLLFGGFLRSQCKKFILYGCDVFGNCFKGEEWLYRGYFIKVIK